MKNIERMIKSNKQLVIVAALVIIAGGVLLSQNSGTIQITPPPQNIVSQGNVYPTVVQIVSYQEPQLVQDFQNKYLFTASLRINNTDPLISKFFTVAYTFHTSKHGDVTYSLRRYLGAGESSSFEFSTLGKAEIQADETATGNFVVIEG